MAALVVDWGLPQRIHHLHLWVPFLCKARARDWAYSVNKTQVIYCLLKLPGWAADSSLDQIARWAR